MTRPTLHDELMREAGFESDYHSEAARRRQEQRRRIRAARYRIFRFWYRALLLLCLVAAAADFFGLVHYAPKAVSGAVSVIALIVLRADSLGLGALVRRLGLIPAEEEDPLESRGLLRRVPRQSEPGD